ncbi:MULTISPECIES: stage III sporulation protein AF [Pontibacillus]|uniref:Stage III sporulation protein AF n=1 Tax=Pontibacillus chungwhensis TaxID=265426 RepID=A0ABY8UU98_9BACI|nr:stage III sporulation protein AF [Pontibacillus chungwhensis]MCD5323522.1 stage III sporulation protein AF [Pontibacillus sp. HN14]WIF96893.1 stage III sporulation protein AF [Pontibacillus chungwhensis]
MAFITEWVTQIILFLLLALVTDLLLPASSFRKYIKLVVGLLLILVFLQPVFKLFDVDMDQFFTREMNRWNDQAEVESMKNSIEEKKKEIQASQRAYILEQMAVQLENEVKEELMNDHNVEIQNFSFQFKTDAEVNLEGLKSLNITLAETNKQEAGSDEVEEIVIDLNQQPKDQEGEQSLDAVRSYLSSAWDIPEDQLILQWEGGVQ